MPQSLEECYLGLRPTNWHKQTYFEETLTHRLSVNQCCPKLFGLPSCIPVEISRSTPAPSRIHDNLQWPLPPLDPSSIEHWHPPLQGPLISSECAGVLPPRNTRGLELNLLILSLVFYSYRTFTAYLILALNAEPCFCHCSLSRSCPRRVGMTNLTPVDLGQTCQLFLPAACILRRHSLCQHLSASVSDVL